MPRSRLHAPGDASDTGVGSVLEGPSDASITGDTINLHGSPQSSLEASTSSATFELSSSDLGSPAPSEVEVLPENSSASKAPELASMACSFIGLTGKLLEEDSGPAEQMVGTVRSF